jgi:SAM-dependent methyltransferase
MADGRLRGEYAREIAPRTELALARVLEQLFDRSPVTPTTGFRALDLGAGTGAVGRVLRERFGAAIEVVAVDKVAAPGVLRADLSRALPPLIDGGRFDLIVAAHLLNELFVEQAPADRVRLRADRVRAWVDTWLAPDGAITLLEPALRETARELHAVRDRLVDAGLHVVAPCFWTGPCPALIRERDWCHDAASSSARRVDFSYIALRRARVPASTTFRVVSDPMREKGRLRLFVCGPGGRRPLVRLTRDRAPANALLDRTTRGDAIQLHGADESPDTLRITPATTITRTLP